MERENHESRKRGRNHPHPTPRDNTQTQGLNNNAQAKTWQNPWGRHPTCNKPSPTHGGIMDLKRTQLDVRAIDCCGYTIN